MFSRFVEGNSCRQSRQPRGPLGKPRSFALSAAVTLAALAAGAIPANAQFACSPATVPAGAEFHLTSAARDAFPLLRRPVLPRLVIQDAGTMYFTISQCVLLFPGLKARIWFPDGTKSDWQRVRTDWDH